jgi:putative transposase
MYGAVASPTLISSATDAVMDEFKAWQYHPLDALHPIICIDVHSRQGAGRRRGPTQALYLAIGVNLEGMKEELDPGMAQAEGAKFWLQVGDRIEETRRG